MILDQSSWIFNMMYKMHQWRASLSNFPQIQKKFPGFSGFSKKVSGPHAKLKKKNFFNSSKSLLQHPLVGILRRAGPKNGRNGPSSFGLLTPGKSVLRSRPHVWTAVAPRVVGSDCTHCARPPRTLQGPAAVLSSVAAHRPHCVCDFRTG